MFSGIHFELLNGINSVGYSSKRIFRGLVERLLDNREDIFSVNIDHCPIPAYLAIR